MTVITSVCRYRALSKTPNLQGRDGHDIPGPVCYTTVDAKWLLILQLDRACVRGMLALILEKQSNDADEPKAEIGRVEEELHAPKSSCLISTGPVPFSCFTL